MPTPAGQSERCGRGPHAAFRRFPDQAAAGKPRPLKLWLDASAAEGEAAEPMAEFTMSVADCRRMVETLADKGYDIEHEVHYEEVEEGRHYGLDWGARVDRMLLYFFGTEQTDAEPAGVELRQRVSLGERQ